MKVTSSRNIQAKQKNNGNKNIILKTVQVLSELQHTTQQKVANDAKCLNANVLFGEVLDALQKALGQKTAPVKMACKKARKRMPKCEMKMKKPACPKPKPKAKKEKSAPSVECCDPQPSCSKMKK